MNRTEWNALQVGHHVLVHDEDDAASALIPGRVTEVDDAAGSQRVTIRLSPPGRKTRMVEPRRLAVHLETGETTERCWRCEMRFAAAN